MTDTPAVYQTAPPIIPTVRASLERLTHFHCCQCEQWWSIGDFDALRWPARIYCPRCGLAQQLPEQQP
jgi:hypothetical protein